MTTSDFCLKLGVPVSVLLRLAKNKDKCYYTYYIKKKSGGLREIDAPNVELKGIQIWILRNLLENVPIHSAATAFIRNKSIRHNAEFHLDRKFLLNMDLKDFFPTIVTKDVVRLFSRVVEDDELAVTLAQLCTYKEYLPQGAVTSPAISNLHFKRFDDAIATKASDLGVNYSRYADDLSFSSNVKERLSELLPEVIALIAAGGFKINPKKTRLVSSGSALSVTGLFVNSGRVTVGRSLKRKVKALLFKYIYDDDRTVSKKKILGYISFIRSIEPDYRKNLKEYILRVREKKELRPKASTT